MFYEIYQIKLSKEVTDYVNSNDRGHQGAEEKFPIYEAHMRNSMSFRKEGFQPEDFAHYTKVCEVTENAGLVQGEDEYLVNDLEEVFKILNGYYYDEDTEKDVVFDNHVSGYQWKTITRKDGEVITYRDMHSLSVGDIVAERTVQGTKYYQVADIGFKEVFPSESSLLMKNIKEAS